MLFGGKAEAPPPIEPTGLSVPAGRPRFDFDRSGEGGWQRISESFRVPAQDQVRIEQRVTIRVAPRRPLPRRNPLVDLSKRGFGGKFNERKMGDCIGVASLAGVQVNGDDRLVLFLRDRRMVSARLERSCRARDFYLGFYLRSSGDGRLCVDRDTLLSRSGASCKLTRIRLLVPDDD